MLFCYREVVINPGACVPLQLKHGGLNLMKLNEPPLPLKLNVKVTITSNCYRECRETLTITIVVQHVAINWLWKQ